MKHLCLRVGHPSAFSLIKLLVVVAIIAILAALPLPVSAKAKAPGPSLGLDGGSDSMNLEKAGFLYETQVKSPSDMIAIADAQPLPGGADRDLDDLYPVNHLAESIKPRRSFRANVVFATITSTLGSVPKSMVHTRFAVFQTQ